MKRTSESTIATLTSNLSGAERRNALLQEELEHAQASARERGGTINALREELEQLEESRANTSTSMAMDNEQWAVVRAELTQLRSTMALNTRLTAEVSKLRSRNQNVEILREEKRDLERKLARLEEYKERASKLQGELEAAKMERESWYVFSNPHHGVHPLFDLPHMPIPFSLGPPSLLTQAANRPLPHPQH